MNHLWTWSGRYIGYRERNHLYTYSGRLVGRFVGEEIFTPDGTYLGELKDGRLVADGSKRAGVDGRFGAAARRREASAAWARAEIVDFPRVE